jgi:List-Bact-rpt repeat protein
MARLLLVGLTVASLAVVPSAASAATTTLQIVTSGLGSVAIVPAPISSVDPQGNDCPSPQTVIAGDRAAITSCALTYDVGTTVTLAASGEPANGDGPATVFAQWSDERCSAAQCALTLGADAQTLAALFSPQRISVLLSGAGTVTSPQGDLNSDFDTGEDCTSDGSFVVTCFGDFPLGARVGLAAVPTDSSATVTWVPKAIAPSILPLCDSATPPPCVVTLDRPRWASVAFGDAEGVDSTIPPEVDVNFRIRKTGSGTGTVRSQSIDCGGRCEASRKFGDGESLEATPDGGSRFDHWGAACGTAPRCSLAVGPVTAVTAVFERGSSSGPVPGGGGSANRSLRARVLKLNVRGHGRRRAILIRLQLNAASTVRAVLLRGRRQVAAKRFRVRAGSHLLRFRVPVRARPGRYRLRLTIRGDGQTKQLTQRVRLRR